MNSTEICFVAVTDSLADVAKSVGIPGGDSGEKSTYAVCPFVVGDLISYPSAPGLAFRVVWRLYAHAAESEPAYWILGIEKAAHPLVAPT